MRVLVSLLNFRPGQIGGAETYLRELIPQLPIVAPDLEFVLLATPQQSEVMPFEGKVVTVPVSEARLLRGRTWEAFSPWGDRLMTSTVRRIAPDVAFFPQQSLYPKFVRCPAVVTVHDLQHLVFPRNFSRSTRLYRRCAYDFALHRATRIIAISEFTRQQLLTNYPLPSDKVMTVRHGVRQAAFPVTGPPQIPQPYLYCPAATFPHKGHRQLLLALAQLKQQGRLPGQLILTGQQTPEWSRLRELIGQLDLQSHVQHLGFVPIRTVWNLYQHATAVLFPTQYEGFGLPVLEAVRAGCRVIASQLPVFDEIGLPTEWQIDFAQPDELLQALTLPGPTRLNFPPNTWAECARLTVDILRRAAKGQV